MKHVFLNDVAYSEGEEDPLESLTTALAFAVDDWGHTRAMSWVWGIVCGWDDEAMASQAARHGWDANAVARLKRLHEAFEARRVSPTGVAELLPGSNKPANEAGS